MLANSDSQHFLQAGDTSSTAATDLYPVTDALIKTVLNISFLAAVAYARSEATITIGSTTAAPTSINATDFVASSTAAVAPSASPIGVKIGSFAVGVADTDADTTIGDATITTTGDTTIRASSNDELSVVAYAQLENAAAVAVTVTRYNTTALVQPAATITAGGNISVQADTTFDRQTVAQTVGGPAGEFGAAVAVDDASGYTHAYLDGKATAGSNVNVTATELTTPLSGFQYLNSTQYGYGVTASAGTGPATTGNSINDLKNYIIAPIAAWAKEKIFGKSKTPEPATFQLVGAIAVDVMTFTTTATIGDGVAGDPATVTSPTGVNVFSSVTSTPNIGAGAAADSTQINQSREENSDEEDGDDESTKPINNGGALAVDIGDFTNNATATIAGNAAVDSGGPLSVMSDPNNIFNPADTEFTNLAYPFESGQDTATYNSNSGSKTMKEGETVDVQPGYTGGGDAGGTYQYTGPQNALVNLGTTNYANPNNWTPYNIAETTAESFLINVASYLDGNLGLSNNLATSTASAIAIGQKKLSIAGSVSVILLENTSTATIDTGAQINQGTYTTNTPGTVTVQPNQTVRVEPGHAAGGLVGSEYQFIGSTPSSFNLATTNFANSNDWSEFGQQDVLVQAENENDTINYVGNLKLPGFRPNTLGGVGAGGSGTARGVGVAVLTLETTAKTTAQIQDGVSLYADDLAVEANNEILAVGIGVSGGKSTNFGLNGVVLYNSVDDTTIASIGAGASVTVGSAHVILPGTPNPFNSAAPVPSTDTGDSTYVEANDDVKLVTAAGSIAEGQKTGVGASIALNDVSRDTEAFIGNAYNASSGPTPGGVNSTGPIAIDATNSGFIYAVAVAGAVATKPDPPSNGDDEDDEDDEEDDNPPAAPEKTTFDLAVAVAMNTVNDGDLAYVNGATVQSSAGISLDAQYTPNIGAFTIGGAINTTAGQTGVALAGAYSANVIDGLTVESFITQTAGNQSTVTATAGNISLTANDGSAAFSDAGAFSLAWSGMPSEGASETTEISMGLSIALDNVGQHTGNSILAYIHNSTVTASGSVILSATSTAKDQVLAVGGAISGAKGAPSAETVIGAAGGGAYAAANIANTIETYVDGGSVVTTTKGSGGDIDLTATDSTKLIDSDAFGIAVAYAAATGAAEAGSVAIGVGIAQNSISNTVKSYINAAKALADAGITLDASSSPDVHALGLGVAAAISRGSDSTGALAGAGSAATNSVNDTIAAYITACTTANQQPVTAGTGGVSVTASDSASVTADAAAFSLAGALAEGEEPAVAIAVGASIAENNVGTGSGEAIKAYIDGSDVSAAGPVVVSATSTATINTLAIGGALAGTDGEGLDVSVAAAGAGTYTTLKQTILSSIQDASTVTTTLGGNVTVTATDSSTILADAGGVSISLAYGEETSVSGSIGAANANNTMNDTVKAFIDSSSVTASGGISVTAVAQETPGSSADYQIDALAFGVAASGSVSTEQSSIALDGAGSSALNTIDNVISAYINNCGGANEISAAGTGVSAADPALEVSASDQLTVRADSGGYALAIAAASKGLAFSGAVGASESKNEVGQNSGDSVEAYINNSKIVVTGAVTLSAVSSASFDALGIGAAVAGAGSGNGALTGALAGAGAGTLNNVAITIESLIEGSSSVTTSSPSGDVSLAATDNTRVKADAGGVAVAIALGKEGQAAITIGASIAKNTVANTIYAAIIGSTVDASGSVLATAQTEADPDQTLTFKPSAVSTASSQIALPGHGLHTGDRVIYNDGGGTPIGGLTNGQSYFVIVVNSNTIELALSMADALAKSPTPISFSSTGTSDNQTLVTLSPTVDALAIGGALSGAKGSGELTLALAGAGASAANNVDNDIEAFITGCSGPGLSVMAGAGGVARICAGPELYQRRRRWLLGRDRHRLRRPRGRDRGLDRGVEFGQ